MAKGYKHLKRLRSEKAKIKLRSKITKPKNVTDTSFKTKKIIIPIQLKQHDETEILSTRKLNIKDLLVRFHHHNAAVREGALRELKEILLFHSSTTLHAELGPLLNGIAALSLDREKNIRKDSLSALRSILECMSEEQLVLYSKVLTSYLNCAMTHINPCIKEDSLHFLDVLLLHCGNMLAKDSRKIFSNFLDMMCRLHSDNKHNRQLTIITNLKTTSVKWRIQVLERLVNMFNCVLSDQKLERSTYSGITLREVEYCEFLPVYGGSSAKPCEINFNDDMDSVTRTGETLPMEEFIKYVDTLMSLMFDIWLEVCPNEKFENYTETTISSDTSVLLRGITKIMQSIIEYIEMLDHDDYKHTKRSFIDKFHKSFMRSFLLNFPYRAASEFTNKSKKCQEDYSEIESNSERCLEQNLGLCQIHTWFTSSIDHDSSKFNNTTKNYCLSIIKYLNNTIKNWCINDKFVLSQLTKLLKTLFLSASSSWHANGIDLNQTLQLIIKVSYLSKNELQSNLSLIVGNIILECNLNELYREAFKKYVIALPSLLLRPSINEATIRMISQVALRFKQWIREELTIKHKAIIENAQKIEIIGSHDDKKSRLMICNLFYFLDAELYY
ncbi:testis-expressed protein 10 homolog [Odontomachus brunneus]|uniref:testis-expressed protein 10 homolog n=1 Tax=Odontomachus brunneus TaxID=486640 RepID=UPI0013F219F5|nr:testis-expressed protein 10 homolog [Odontomachus brunneus]